MRALGKGSIAEIIRVGLIIAWAVLWAAGAVLLAIAAAFALNSAHIVNLNGFFSPDSGVRISIRDNAFVLPPGAPTWPLFVAAMLVGAVAIIGGLMIVWRLRKLFDSFCSGQPFALENATHLRAIWITMVGIEAARYVLLFFTAFLFSSVGGPLAHSEIRLNFDLSTWASILILIVLAEVFREGSRMRAEQELTI